VFDATFYGNFGPKNSAFVWVGKGIYRSSGFIEKDIAPKNDQK